MTTVTRLKTAPKLHVVKGDEAPDHSYEWQHRQRIASRDWSGVHITADKRTPFATVMGKLR